MRKLPGQGAYRPGETPVTEVDRKTAATLASVKDFWERTPCGEIFTAGTQEGDDSYFEDITRERYRWEYHLQPFLDEVARAGKKVLEIGCGMGIDSSELAKRGCELTGIDLTERAIGLARRNFERLKLHGEFKTGNAEHLDFPDSHFDCVYSMGVLHHTPDTARAIAEVLRVLKPGGSAFIMLYSSISLNHLAHWILRAPYEYSREAGKDAPVTRMYSRSELVALFRDFEACTFRKRYLFGAGWKPVSNWVPTRLNDWLGRVFGWHWMIVAKKPG